MSSTPKYAGMYYQDPDGYNVVKLIHLPSGEVFKSLEAALAHEKWLAEWEAKWGDG
mgnify:FL=1